MTLSRAWRGRIVPLVKRGAHCHPGTPLTESATCVGLVRPGGGSCHPPSPDRELRRRLRPRAALRLAAASQELQEAPEGSAAFGSPPVVWSLKPGPPFHLGAP